MCVCFKSEAARSARYRCGVPNLSCLIMFVFFTYLIFVIFFTLTYFEAWKFYTQKCVNLRQKLPRDKIA